MYHYPPMPAEHMRQQPAIPERESDEVIAKRIAHFEAEIARIEAELQQPLDTSGDIAYQHEHSTDPNIAYRQSAEGRRDYVQHTHLPHLKRLLAQAIAERDRRSGSPEARTA